MEEREDKTRRIISEDAIAGAMRDIEVKEGTARFEASWGTTALLPVADAEEEYVTRVAKLVAAVRRVGRALRTRPR